jgi:hypothetical protein
MSVAPAAQQQRTAVTYYIMREGAPKNTIIAIHRVYDSAVACFQQIMDTCAVETMDMWGVCTNNRGIKTVEWIIHSYVRATPRDGAVLAQHGVAGIHAEEKVAPLRVPDQKSTADTSEPARLLELSLEMRDCDSP